MKKVRTRKQRKSRNTKFRKTKSRLRTQKRYGKRSKLVKRTKSKRYNKRQKGGSELGETETVVEVSGAEVEVSRGASEYPTLDRLIPGDTFANILGWRANHEKAKQLETAVSELDEEAKKLHSLEVKHEGLMDFVDKVKTEIEQKLATDIEKDSIRQELDRSSVNEGNPLYNMEYIQAYLKITEQGGKEKLGNSIKKMSLLPNYSEILTKMGPIEAAIHIVEDLNSQVLALKEDLAMKEQLHRDDVIKVEQRMKKMHDQQLQDEIQTTIKVERDRALIAMREKEQEISQLKGHISAYGAASESPVFSEGSPSTSAGAGGGETQLEDNNVDITSHGWGRKKEYPKSKIKINATTRSDREGTAEKDIIITRVATPEQKSGSLLSSGSVAVKTIPFNFSDLTQVKIDREKSTLYLAFKQREQKHHTFTIKFHDTGGEVGGERMTLISGVQIEGSPIEKAVKIFSAAMMKNLLTDGTLTIV